VTGDADSLAGDRPSERQTLSLAGAVLLGGFVVNIIATLFHPKGAEDDHKSIFTEYADSGGWVAIHLGQFIGVLIALGGLLVLYRVFMVSGDAPLLARLAAVATIATTATWAVLQAVDGVALQQAIDAWVGAGPAQETIRLADTETVRWLEEGVQSYFWILLGLSIGLFGRAVLVRRLIAAWLAWVAVLAGLLSIAIGINVGYSGLESGFGDVAVIVFQLAVLVFAVGLFVSGRRLGGQLTAAGG
jgi:hypothetical protein